MAPARYGTSLLKNNTGNNAGIPCGLEAGRSILTESAIQPEYIRKIKKIQARLSKGRAKTCASMDDFIAALRQ